MAKVNPAMLKRPAVETVDFCWTSPMLPEPITGTFKKQSSMAWNRANEEAQSLLVLHVTGIGEEGTPGFVEPTPLPPTDGQKTVASYQGFCIACLLSSAQVTQNPADRYTPIDIICFMQDEVLAEKIAADTNKLRIEPPKEVNDDPNRKAASTEKQ